ncbi:hypothetical protein GMOD_00005830 [Pyrenophora seminiperda CCB06]|uniref:Uncharacterized protein n=1 Tax=Pyrenophora seminiperda CCB06 TaxID=1302712 RepID=A0A3M7M9V5_9PLEO|nr:hypothetical protein GMOD_00005830 [Pyrenophora seminiperda CCB06]
MAATATKRDSMDATTSNLETKLKTTSLSQPPSKRQPLGLTDLPPSIRNNIYKYCLDTEVVNVGLPNVSYTHTITDSVLKFHASRSPFPIATSLFYVNKAISKEALHFFYSKNLWVRLHVYSADARHVKTLLQDSGLLFSTAAAPEAAEKCTQHALEVVLVEKNSGVKRASVFFPAQYLPRLINFLNQASRATGTWAPMHKLFLDVVNTYDFPLSRLQGDLLELFRLLSNFGGVEVNAKNLLPRYAEGLQTNMTSPSFTVDGYLASVTELADLADAARSQEKYNLATEYAQATIIALTYGYLTHAETLHSQPEDFSKTMQRLRWRTELGLAISLSLPHRSLTSSSTKNWLRTPPSPTTPQVKKAASDLLLAESSASKALSLATDSPSPVSNPWYHSLPVELIPSNKPTYFTDRERAQTWYALGTVHTALGEYIFACGDMERALELWGKDSGVDEEGGLRGRIEEAFDKARQGIDGDAQSMWVGDVRPGTGLKRAAKLARGL